MRVTVFGLWHLGSVTAACLADAGFDVVGLDLDEKTIGGLQNGRAPLHEPGLDEMIRAGSAAGRLRFTTDPAAACADADVVWIAFDTPVNENDEADVDWVRRQLDGIEGYLRPGTIVLISSQVPVGFTRALEERWTGRRLHFAVSPENLRLGKALECFRKPERIVVGSRNEHARARLQELLEPFCKNILWMSVESAEMTKHAVNAFLATSVTFVNELARICEAVGASAKDVERGLKSESRIGPKAYLSPGAAFAGGTLARDIQFLMQLAKQREVSAPFFEGVWAGNRAHQTWARNLVARLLEGVQVPVAAVLGLTYKPGTDTLRRSSAIEMCRHLADRGVQVRGHDPAVSTLPGDLSGLLELCESPEAAITGADVAIIATEWPAFKNLPADLFAKRMRRPCVIDANHFLATALAADQRIVYCATGLPRTDVSSGAGLVKPEPAERFLRSVIRKSLPDTGLQGRSRGQAAAVPTSGGC
jgi:UDPglucose 6-dehydrogenase